MMQNQAQTHSSQEEKNPYHFPHKDDLAARNNISVKIIQKRLTANYCESFYIYIKMRSLTISVSDLFSQPVDPMIWLFVFAIQICLGAALRITIARFSCAGIRRFDTTMISKHWSDNRRSEHWCVCYIFIA